MTLGIAATKARVNVSKCRRYIRNNKRGSPHVPATQRHNTKKHMWREIDSDINNLHPIATVHKGHTTKGGYLSLTVLEGYIYYIRHSRFQYHYIMSFLSGICGRVYK